MRKVKLRGWYKGEMIPCLTVEKLMACFRRSGLPHCDSSFLRDFEIMGATGMHDRKNQEIYTDDIVKVVDQTHPLYGTFYRVYWDEEKRKYEPFGTHKGLEKHCLVIGNIYQHPTLLNRISA